MYKSAARAFLLVSLSFLFGTIQLFGQPGGKPVQNQPKSVKNLLDKGDFKVGFSPQTKAKTPKKEMPKDEKAILQGIAESLNSLIALPKRYLPQL